MLISNIKIEGRVVSTMDDRKGIVTIEIETEQLNPEQMEILEDLFPNTFKMIDKALMTEAVISKLR